MQVKSNKPSTGFAEKHHKPVMVSVMFLMFALRNLWGYNKIMIKSFLHKGLQKFYQKGTTAGIQKKHEKKLRLILSNLDLSEQPDDMDLPGLYMHKLKGDKKDIWSVRVSGNWRITYRFVDKDIELVNYEDYH